MASPFNNSFLQMALFTPNQPMWMRNMIYGYRPPSWANGVSGDHWGHDGFQNLYTTMTGVKSPLTQNQSSGNNMYSGGW